MVDIHDHALEVVDSRHETWRSTYEADRDRLAAAFAAADCASAVDAIYHVGSTAVPDLPAKDIVDIDVVIADDITFEFEIPTD